MKSKQELNTERQKAVARGVGVACDFFVEKAKNAEIWTTDGERYIDFAGGIGVLNTGHLHPKVQAAVAAQLQQFSHTCYHVIPYALYTEVASKINSIAPIDGEKKTMFATTGAEAVENAIKIARSYTRRRGVIAFQGAFHGRTNFALGLTGKVAPYKLNFGPFPADVVHAPYPNALHGISVAEAIEGLHKIFKTHIDPNDVAAIIIEPIQGEGGFNITPNEFLHALRQECDQHGIVLIFDEVQSGFARTGKMFATEHTGISPDLMTMAKSMAGGFTLSGVVGKAKIMDAPEAGGLGGTYAGHPLALAAAKAAIEVIEEEKLCERANILGKKLQQFFENLKNTVPNIQEVRARGAMVAVEFAYPDHSPDDQLPKKVQQIARDNGLILLTCGMYYNVMRFLFPLTIEDAIFDEALNIIEKSFKKAV